MLDFFSVPFCYIILWSSPVIPLSYPLLGLRSSSLVEFLWVHNHPHDQDLVSPVFSSLFACGLLLPPPFHD